MKKNLKISMIVAMSQNRVIGKNNTLPWRVPADSKRFREITTGHVVIMGRKTYESMGRPLPNRLNIILTHSSDYQSSEQYLVARSPQEALELAQQNESSEIFIVGGAEIYKQYMAIADQIYLTLIHQDFDGDTFFPEFKDTYTKIINTEDHLDNSPPFSYITYTK